GELTIAPPQSFTTWDFNKSTTNSDQPYYNPVFDRLITIWSDKKNGVEYVPQLAKSYQVAADGLSISFVLRTDAGFQDGTKFNAAAAKANLERAKTGIAASLIKSMTTIDAPDDTHLVVHLSQPDPTVLEVLAGDRPGNMMSPAQFNNPDLA